MTLIKARKQQELSPSQLKWACNINEFDFESTSTLEPIDGIVGQERALKALKLGVDMKSPGYNIFITGLSGTGKFTTVKKVLESISDKKAKLFDYAYVYNFQDEDHPSLLSFNPGQAIKFKNDITETIQFFKEQIPEILESDTIAKSRKKLIDDFSSKQEKIMADFETKLNKSNFTLGQIEAKGMTRPEIFLLIDKKPIHISQINEIAKTKKITKKKVEKLIKDYSIFQNELQKIFSKLLFLTKGFQKELVEIESSIIEDLVKTTLAELIKKYKTKNVKRYLIHLGQFIAENPNLFKIHLPEANQENINPTELVNFYVNVILDNSQQKEKPVIVETTPSYGNLFGTIEKYTTDNGGFYSDFTGIRAGAILKANGGYLILNAIDVYQEPGVWKALKRVLQYGKIIIQEVPNQYQLAATAIKPEPIEINTKIILIGNNYSYSMLSSYENDFNKIFKVKAEFDSEMNRSEKSLVEYARIIKKLIMQENLLEFDRSAIARIIEYGARYAGNQNKLTTRFAYVADLARESNFWAIDVGDKIVSQFHVIKAFEFSKERHSLYESKVTKMIEEETILIDTKGFRVGQINGLAVYGGNQFSFGKPTRITASVALGNGSIINVEREAGLSGSSHNKAILIIGGYFKEKFGKRIPLSFNASIVFEQGYGKIDGDSASITEIAALVSAISEIPINQSFAITGSVNQKGDIQPIGGVNEKIEGFFDICKLKGLTKKQGVIIPIQNVKDLMLKDEIIEAVINKEFHIYAVSTVEKALEILMGVKAGRLTTTCRYQTNTIFGEVERHLKEMRRRVRNQPKKKPEQNNNSEVNKLKTKK